MSAIESAVRVLVDLLIRGEYETLEKVTGGRRLAADRLRNAAADYGRLLVEPGDKWWDVVEVTPIDAGERAAFHVAAPLWTEKEGRSDLTQELRLQESAPHVYEMECLTFMLCRSAGD